MTNQNQSRSVERGDVAVYLALLILFIITASTLLMSGILARQIRNTSNSVNSERAFYAASTGIEKSFFYAAKKQQAGEVVSGEVSYETAGGGAQAATYTGSITVDDTGRPCGNFTGTFVNETRRLAVGDNECAE